jgi:dolichyl-phosphate-mannose-protein mannosyltransferase
MPAAGWGLLHGVPIGLAGAAVLFAIWWTWWFRGTLPGRRALIALVMLKLVAGLGVSIERGLEADYFANVQWAPPIERSPDFRSRSFTRIDRQLDFGGPDRPGFPVYFFNDAARFNFYQRGEPDRDDLPFSVTWQGYVRAPRAEDRRQFYLRGTGVTAELWVDGAQTVHLNPTASDAFDRALWPAGVRHLTVRVSVPAGASRRFEAGYVDSDGRQIPFDATNIAARPYPRWRISADVVVRFVSRIIDVLLLAALVGLFAWTLARMVRAATTRGAEQRDAMFALSWIVLMAGGLLSARSAMGRVVILGGGQDLTYESYARDILLNGPLMLLAHPAGQSAPFYYQPLYPYFLALTHLIFGEDLSGVYLVQWLLAGVTVIVIWKISARLFGSQAGHAALVLVSFYFVGKLVPMAGLLLTENLFMPLVVLWTLSMIRMAVPEAGTADTVRAGISGGLSALARSTSIAAWVFALPLLALSRRRAGKSQQAVLVMVAIMIAVLAVAAISNWIASRTLLPIAFNCGVNVQNFEQKARYALGFSSALAPTEGTAPELIATWAAALIGISVMIWGRVADGLRGPIRVLPLAIAVSHFLVVTLVFPVERLIIPLYILLLPYAALGVIWSIDFLVPPEEE